jgi:Type IV pilin-like G and H, putative
MENEEAYKKGKSTLGSIDRAQHAYTLEFDTFTQNVIDLGLGQILDKNNYTISMILSEERRKIETVQTRVTQFIEKPIEIDSEQEIELPGEMLIQFKKFVGMIAKLVDLPAQQPNDEWMIPLKQINQIYELLLNLDPGREVQLKENCKIQIKDLIQLFDYVFDIYGKDEVSREEGTVIKYVEKLTVTNLAVQIFVQAKREGLKSFTSVVWRNEEIEDEMSNVFTLRFESDRPTQEMPPNIQVRSNFRWDEVNAPIGYSKFF